MLKILKNRKCLSRIRVFTEMSNICVCSHASFIAQHNEVVRETLSLHKCRWGVYLLTFSFCYSFILLYCLYDVLTNIYAYLLNVMSLMLSNEVGYNYDAETLLSKTMNTFLQTK